MKTEVNPKDTTRAEAFEMWITSPMPMVTLTKTFNVSRLLKVSKKLDVKFNALLCWCIGKAATQQGPYAAQRPSLEYGSGRSVRRFFISSCTR